MSYREPIAVNQAARMGNSLFKLLISNMTKSRLILHLQGSEWSYSYHKNVASKAVGIGDNLSQDA